MTEFFMVERWIAAGMAILFVISTGMRLFLGILYGKLLRDTENMAVTKNAALKQCKTKFIKCFQLNGGVSNVPVFVDKFLNRLSIGPFYFEELYHFSGQSMLLGIVLAGFGICRTLAAGRGWMQAIPFYFACFVGLYLYFSVSAAVDVPEKKRILKVNLVDYLENHLASRIGLTQEDMERLGYVEPGERFAQREPESLRRMEREPKALGKMERSPKALGRMEGEPAEPQRLKCKQAESRRMEHKQNGPRWAEYDQNEMWPTEDCPNEGFMQGGQGDGLQQTAQGTMTDQTREVWDALLKEIMT